MGKLFESLITHKHKKEKFVFDKTINKKDGWISIDDFVETRRKVIHDKMNDIVPGEEFV